MDYIVFVKWSDHDKLKRLEYLHVKIQHCSMSEDIGGRDDSSPSLEGTISSLEIYVVGKTPGDGDGVPDALRNLIISCQLVSNHNEEPPKKKKI